MATVTGLTLVKKFDYRGNPNEEFSNTYHFKNGPPGDAASWTVLTNDVVAKERLVLPSSVQYTRAYGYDSDDPKAHHVFAIDWEAQGGGAAGSLPTPPRVMAGDQAACVKWKTARLNSRGKPIYLRKYLHHGGVDTAVPDQLDATYFAALEVYADIAQGVNGIHGGMRSRTHDETVEDGHAIGWVTTRTLKRRGRRPRQAS
jgi:hypothetical protein